MFLLPGFTCTKTRHARVLIVSPKNTELPTRLITSVGHHVQTPEELNSVSRGVQETQITQVLNDGYEFFPNFFVICYSYC
jgi:hypothetical protein